VSERGAPRCLHLSQAEAKAVIGAMSGVAQVYHAACAATGLEYQAARRLRFRDVDMFSGTMLADGKKTTGRGRTAAQYRRWIWAWVYVVSHVTQNLGIDANAFVFAELSEWEMRQALKDACEKVGVADYRPHDWRHTWAVQAIRDGFPLNTVAAQLGHKDAVMTLRVYGKFQPIATDFERVNAALPAEEEKEAAAGMHAAIDQAMAEGKPIEL
jgi:integrase